jgi:hypothetical protein
MVLAMKEMSSVSCAQSRPAVNVGVHCRDRLCRHTPFNMRD